MTYKVELYEVWKSAVLIDDADSMEDAIKQALAGNGIDTSEPEYVRPLDNSGVGIDEAQNMGIDLKSCPEFNGDYVEGICSIEELPDD